MGFSSTICTIGCDDGIKLLVILIKPEMSRFIRIVDEFTYILNPPFVANETKI